MSRKETIAEEPERTGSMPWTRPSRSNRSLNNDFVIAADLHDGAGDPPEIGDTDLVRVHPFGRDMDAAGDEPLSVFLDLSHKQQGRAAEGNSHRNDVALARLVDEDDIDVLRGPSLPDIICHWPTFSSTASQGRRRGRRSSPARARFWPHASALWPGLSRPSMQFNVRGALEAFAFSSESGRISMNGGAGDSNLGPHGLRSAAWMAGTSPARTQGRRTDPHQALPTTRKSGRGQLHIQIRHAQRIVLD